MDISEIFIKDCSKNLIQNGGMEVGNPPTGTSPHNSPEILERSGIDKHSGSYSLHIVDSVPSSAGSFLYDLVNSKIIGRTYKFSYWYKIVSGSIQMQFLKGDGSSAIIFANHFDIGNWNYGELVGVEGGAGGPYYGLVCNLSGIAPAEFYIDDISVCEM